MLKTSCLFQLNVRRVMVYKKPCRFFNAAGAFSLFLSFLLLSSTEAVAQINTKLDSLQRVHVNLRFGMFIHFNMNTFYPGWGENRVDPRTFAPTNVDCGQWARAAVSAKMKYAILTTKHHDGFALWPSAQNAPNGLPHYTVMESAYPHDIVRMFVDSMRAFNIIPCLYFSGWDQASGIPGPYNFRPDTLVWSRYSTFVLGQITELLGGTYGQIPLFVFDGYSWDMGHKAFPYEIIRSHIKRLQPNCLILDHNGATPWEVDIEYFEEPLGITAPAGNTYPSCQGQTISGDWFWNSSAADIGQLKTLSDILNHLTTLEPRYCNFVLNCPPNRTGIFDNAIVTRLGQIGPVWSPNASRPSMPTPPSQLDRPFTPVSATATSANSSAFNAIDNANDFSGSSHTQTLWTSTSALPQSVTLDLGRARDSIDMLMYQPRRFGSTVGNITSYRIYVSTNGTTFTQITAGTSSSGTWGTWPADSTIKWARFAQQNARYVRLEAVAVSSGTAAVVNTIAVGAYLPYSQMVGVKEQTTLVAVRPAAPSILKAISTITLEGKFSGKTNTVAIYDLTGKLVGTKTVTGISLDLKKEMGVSDGVYVVKINNPK
jgi:alpha-L-fucosidase